MSTKKQEKETRRQQRMEAEKREAAAQRRRLVLGYAVAGVLGGIVLVAAVILLLRGGDSSDEFEGRDLPEAAHVDLNSGTPPRGVSFDDREGTPPPALALGDLAAAAEEAGCELNLDLTDEGAGHLAPDDKPPEYETSPPTSGDHDPVPAADGAYADSIEPINFVHAMEHGRILILYDPKLSEKDQLALKGVFDEDPQGMLIFPYEDMPYEVAVTAWTQMAGCPSYDAGVLDVIRDFRDTYRSQGPENVPL